MRIAHALSLAAALLLPLACTQTRDLEVTPWFTVRQEFPKAVMGMTSGPARRQTYFTLVEGAWVQVGQGDRGRVLALDGGAAILFTPDTSTELQLLYEGEKAARPLSQLLQGESRVTVSPGGVALDVVRCETKGFAGCLSLEVRRYLVRAKRAESHTVGLPVSETGCDYPELAVVGYDGEGTPYFAGRCEGMNPRCILVAPRADGLLVRTRAKSPDSFLCGRPEYWTPDLSAPLIPPALFTQLPVGAAE